MHPSAKNSGSKGKLVVGITGNAGSGKTTLARMLADLGATVIEADRVGHEVLQLPEVKRQLQAAFGPDILQADGTVNRKRLGLLTFQDAQALATLTRIVKPWIVERIRQQIQSTPTPIVVVDGALIYEYGVEDLFDLIVVVTAPEEVRLQRFLAKTGYPREVALRMFQQQMPEAEKARRADVVIQNQGSLEDLRAKARHLYKTWQRRDP